MFVTSNFSSFLIQSFIESLITDAFQIASYKEDPVGYYCDPDEYDHLHSDIAVSSCEIRLMSIR